jgi:histidinol dehydrogenase
MKVYKNTTQEQLLSLLKRPTIETGNLESAVGSILKQVKKQGDQALFELTNKFDQVQLSSLKVSRAEIKNATQLVSPELANAIDIAKNNIWRFHLSQKEEPLLVETMPGVQCWRKSVGIDKVGLYIPGGTAPLFSTVLMLGIPAKIADCKEIVLCTPPRKDGSVDPAILYTAQLIGITSIYKVGGAQAIAAMAFGTETIPAVHKIFGPGNQYVTEAKQQANRTGVAIDMPAGPSELMVVADQSAVPQFVAADLLSQAEHGIDSQVVLVAFEENFVNQVLSEITEQLTILPRKTIAEEALKNSVAVIANNKDEALNIINFYAPEHLLLALENAVSFSSNIRNAGSVFIGNFTPESAGDYASGTNHTLPTNGYANAYSGVSLDSFVKKITFQKITKEGLQNLGPAVEIMAEAEQLQAHKNAVSIRLENMSKEQSDLVDIKSVTFSNTPEFSITNLIRPDLRDFQPYSSARDEFEGQAEIFLDANENPFDTDLNRYPDPQQHSLKTAIANLKGLQISNIFLGNGSDEAIDLLIRLFCETGNDSILTFAPTYGVYNVCARTAGVQVKSLPLDENFQPETEGLNNFGARNAKILFICNPNNPTASIIPLQVLENIISDFPGIVVIDEAYIDFSEIQSCVSLIDKYPNLVVLQTFSKAWGLAGARLGMALSNPELINWLNKIKLPYNVNAMTQQRVLEKIKKKETVDLEIQTIIAERKKLMQVLADFDFIKKVFPSQTNFVLIRVDDPKALYSFLLKKGIIVRDRSNQVNCEGCIRITIGKPDENEQLISAIQLFKESKTNSLLSSI